MLSKKYWLKIEEDLCNDNLVEDESVKTDYYGMTLVRLPYYDQRSIDCCNTRIKNIHKFIMENNKKLLRQKRILAKNVYGLDTINITDTEYRLERLRKALEINKINLEIMTRIFQKRTQEQALIESEFPHLSKNDISIGGKFCKVSPIEKCVFQRLTYPKFSACLYCHEEVKIPECLRS